MTENYLHLDPDFLDCPIYRIVPVHRLLETLQAREIVLVQPRNWDDPFENLILRTRVRLNEAENRLEKERIYGQCWTLHEETDAMWRIYSKDKEGVRIRTTPRKLLTALIAGSDQSQTCYIGRVQYQPIDQLQMTLSGIQAQGFQSSDIQNSSSLMKANALQLLYKRPEFEHEKEVRLIYTGQAGENYSFHIEPNELIDDIIFDPRMNSVLFDAYKAAAFTLGFTNPIAKSHLYQPPQFRNIL